MELLKTSEEIRTKIDALEALKAELPGLSEEKAKTESDYEKAIAITIIRLINGGEFTLDEQKIKNPPNAMLDKIAKGICWQQKLNMDTADMKYRNTLKIVDITEAQLNGFQSINRHLSES